MASAFEPFDFNPVGYRVGVGMKTGGKQQVSKIQLTCTGVILGQSILVLICGKGYSVI